MYKVTAKTRGKYNNVMPGARYCFTKRSAVKLAVSFASMESEFEVEKLVRLHSDIFAWSDVEVGSDVWEKIYASLEDEEEE